MSFTLTRRNDGRITFQTRYTGDKTPTDLHIALLDAEGGKPKNLIGYPTIPPDMDPKKGIDIDISPGPPNFPFKDRKLAPGVYTFRLIWSFHNEFPDETDQDTPSLTVPETESQGMKPWSWISWGGKVLSGMAASAIAGVVLNWWTVVAIFPCFVTGLLGGFLGGTFGEFLVWLWDDPRIKWAFKNSALFNLFFTLFFAMLFGILSIDLEVAAAERGEYFNRVTLGVSFIAAFLSTLLTGVLNNLREEA